MYETTLRMDIIRLMDIPEELIKPLSLFIYLYQTQEKEIVELINDTKQRKIYMGDIQK